MWMSGSQHQMIYYGVSAYLLRNFCVFVTVLRNRDVRRLGIDGNVPWAHHLEMEDMVAAGMTPSQVIRAATRDAAQVLKLTDLGTVAVGKSADFLVLDANPLENITNTRRISTVYLREKPWTARP